MNYFFTKAARLLCCIKTTVVLSVTCCCHFCTVSFLRMQYQLIIIIWSNYPSKILQKHYCFYRTIFSALERHNYFIWQSTCQHKTIFIFHKRFYNKTFQKFNYCLEVEISKISLNQCILICGKSLLFIIHSFWSYCFMASFTQFITDSTELIMLLIVKRALTFSKLVSPPCRHRT